MHDTNTFCMSRRPSRLAAEAQSDPESPLTPLGNVFISDREGTLTVSIPIDTAREVGLEAGEQMAVSHNPVTNSFVYQPIDDSETDD